MTSIPVIVWGDREDLVQALERGRGPVVVVRQGEDLAEVLAVVGAGVATHAVLAGPAAEITATFTESLRRVGGTATALVADVSDELRLTRLGLQVLPYNASATQVLSSIVGAGRDAGGSLDGGQPGSAPSRGAWKPEPVADATLAPMQPPPPAAGRQAPWIPNQVERPAMITVVWGTHGAPGRSTVALNLAVEQALKGSRVCLVDADTHAASLSPMLGLMDETAGVVRLCRSVAENQFDPVTDTAAHARVRVGQATLRFTSGLPRPQRWAEISADGLGSALRTLASTCDHVIVDVAADAGQDEDLALDTFAPQRNDATVTALDMADRILVVGRADPVGLPRLIRACEELSERIGGADPQVDIVVNGLRAGSAGPRPEASLISAWRRFGPHSMVPSHFLPWDLAAADAAVLQGRALAEVAPRSGLRKAIAALAVAPSDQAASVRPAAPHGSAEATDAASGRGGTQHNRPRGRTRQRAASARHGRQD
jgi:MinD-like ATPase involved in chromosome partitioning or flagellar assembly